MFKKLQTIKKVETQYFCFHLYQMAMLYDTAKYKFLMSGPKDYRYSISLEITNKSTHRHNFNL